MCKYGRNTQKVYFSESVNDMISIQIQGFFENYLIPEVGDKVRKVARHLHEQMPYLGILSWDLSIDRKVILY